MQQDANSSLQSQLATVGFFQGLDASALTIIAEAGQICPVERDAFFFHQDDPATWFYVLLQGQARLSQITPEGHQVILGFVVPGQAVGIVAAMDQAEYPLTLQAVTDCVALGWQRETLLTLFERYPILALRALRMVTGRFVQLQTSTANSPPNALAVVSLAPCCGSSNRLVNTKPVVFGSTWPFRVRTWPT
ncbi:MAG: Crp/Fnr family transcriptional regulator [Chloroflexaceae bacterium]|nr:Crp/Fnr family transcriptional regulator [Chloroflexaceae bacterium]